MFFKKILALSLCAVLVSAEAGLYSAPALLLKQQQPSYNPPAQYSFSYGVQDNLTGDIKSQRESRNGDYVEGSYSLVEPDGSKRIVDYTADAQSGFNAIVRKEGIGIQGGLYGAPLAQAAPPQIGYAPAVATPLDNRPPLAGPAFTEPKPTYGPPSTEYGPAKINFMPTIVQPAVKLVRPAVSYAVPAIRYQAPAVKYVAPSVALASIKVAAPALTYAPAVTNYAPATSGYSYVASANPLKLPAKQTTKAPNSSGGGYNYAVPFVPFRLPERKPLIPIRQDYPVPAYQPQEPSYEQVPSYEPQVPQPEPSYEPAPSPPPAQPTQPTAPSADYGPPSAQPSAPSADYGPPSAQPSVPSGDYGAPQRPLAVPSAEYGAPTRKDLGLFNAPRQIYYAPAATMRFLNAEEAAKIYLQARVPLSYISHVKYSTPYFSYAF